MTGRAPLLSTASPTRAGPLLSWCHLIILVTASGRLREKPLKLARKGNSAVWGAYGWIHEECAIFDWRKRTERKGHIICHTVLTLQQHFAEEISIATSVHCILPYQWLHFIESGCNIAYTHEGRTMFVKFMHCKRQDCTFVSASVIPEYSIIICSPSILTLREQYPSYLLWSMALAIWCMPQSSMLFSQA